MRTLEEENAIKYEMMQDKEMEEHINNYNIKFSKNKKLNNLLNDIYDDMQELGENEITRYKKSFPNESDYNIAQYGNLLVYFNDIRNFYKKHGYKSIDRMSDLKIWDIYKRQVGYIARQVF